jgi:20S proteasome alpha/beta subunit
MSLCLAILNKDYIAIAGDSRASYYKDGEYYAVDDNATKIHQIGNKVIFISGSGWVLDNILEEFKKSSDKSVDHLQAISKKFGEEFRKKFGSINKESRILELLVAEFVDGKGVIYNISVTAGI